MMLVSKKGVRRKVRAGGAKALRALNDWIGRNRLRRTSHALEENLGYMQVA